MIFEHYPPNRKIEGYVYNSQAVINISSGGQYLLGHPVDNKNKNVCIMKMPVSSSQVQELSKCAELQKEIESRNIVKCLDYYQTENNFYMVQEFCDGDSLRHYLMVNHKIPEMKAMILIKDILLGLQELQKHAIIHRNINPSTLMFHNNKLKISSLNNAAFRGQIDKFSQIQSTQFLYNSQEMLINRRMDKNQQYSELCDVFALGVVFYEMLFGSLPWQAPTIRELIDKRNKEIVKFPCNVVVSDYIKRLLLRMLAVNESDRISFDELFQSQLFNDINNIPRRASSVNIQQQFMFNQLHQIIGQNNINIIDVINKVFKDQQHIGIDQFHKFIKEISNGFSKDEIDDIFYQFEDMDDDMISISEFLIKVVHTSYSVEDQKLKYQEDLSFEFMKVLIKRIHQDHINMKDLLEENGISINQKLNFDEFKTLLQKIDPYILNIQIDMLFSKYMKKSQNVIKVKQFVDEIVMLHEQLYGQVQNKSKNSKLHNLKQKLKLTNIDIDYLLNEINIDMNHQLSFNELETITRIIDLSFKREDVYEVFDEIKKNYGIPLRLSQLKEILKC